MLIRFLKKNILISHKEVVLFFIMSGSKSWIWKPCTVSSQQMYLLIFFYKIKIIWIESKIYLGENEFCIQNLRITLGIFTMLPVGISLSNLDVQRSTNISFNILKITGDIYESIWEGKHRYIEIVFTIRLTGYESIG